MDFSGSYFNCWQAAWQFHKGYANMSGSDLEWEMLIDESADILDKYKDTPQHDFVKSLLVAVIGELDRIDKARREQEVKDEKKE